MANTTSTEHLTLSEALALYAMMSERPAIHEAAAWDAVAAELEREGAAAATWARPSIADRARDARLNAMSARARS